MILHPGVIGFYARTNQQLLDRAAAGHQAMLDRWKDEEDAADDAAGGVSARGNYINYMLARAS